MGEIIVSIEMGFTSGDEATDQQFEDFLDAVLEHLDLLGREVNLAASLAARTSEFAISMEANDFESAAAAFLGDLRTALHVAGCATAGWPQFTAKNQVVRSLQDA